MKNNKFLKYASALIDKVVLEIENKSLKIKINRLKRELAEATENNKFLSEENDTLKTAVHKRYITQEEKTKFLISREKKLQEIEQMVRNDTSTPKQIINKIKEG